MKKIVVAITGSIAAYKSAELVRLFKKAGCDVRIVMTKSAVHFITPMTMQALSGNPVVYDILDPAHEMGMGHIELSRWADVIVIAPCSANMIGKLANGIADDLVSAMCLASSVPIILAPSMNRVMWSNAIVQLNLNKLKEIAVYKVVAPESGEQACGEVGEGRLANPLDIFHYVVQDGNSAPKLLTNKKVIITGGPTREAIDPVRYLSNHSSGKMACALADAFVENGAIVTLILGPCSVRPNSSVKFISIITADEMLDVAMKEASQADIFIGAAAVADYRVKSVANHKIKKHIDKDFTLELTKNPDIIKEIAQKNKNLFVVGFAAETQNMILHAEEKLQSKGMDLICVNDVSNDQVFGKDDNEIVIIDTKGEKIVLEKTTKRIQAKKIVKIVADKII